MSRKAICRTGRNHTLNAWTHGVLYTLLLLHSSFVPMAFAGPQGGQVTGGAGSISQSGNTTTINQSSQNMSINWNSYNVNVDERVQYIQPNSQSISLNKILSNQGSTIAGRIDANGQVILVNPNGVFFTPTAVINAGGLIASGLDIKADDFMNGNYIFNEVLGTDGTVVNSGTINASLGGNVALIGKQVKNDGVIVANLGTVNLAAGKEAVLTFDQGGLLGVRVSKEILQDELGIDPAIVNNGSITAEGGRVLLTASVSRDVFSQAVNTTGIEQATSVVVHEDGSFTLSGSGGSGADVVNTGSINTSTSSSDQNIGRIVLIGENVTSSGELRADAQNGNAGDIELHAQDKALLTENSITSARSESNGVGGVAKVLGDKVGVFDQSTIDVSGANGGGQALIGGDFQGKNANIRNASTTVVGANTNIYADALQHGDGGKVILWADSNTFFWGNIFAQGGAVSGNGGLVEVSGKENLKFDGFVDTSAQHGENGNLLLDPRDIIISNFGPDDNEVFDLTVFFEDNQPVDFDISANAIENFLSFGNLLLQANRDIEIQSRIDVPFNTNNLTLLAGDDIRTRSDINLGSGNLLMIAGSAHCQFNCLNGGGGVGGVAGKLIYIEGQIDTLGSVDLYAADHVIIDERIGSLLPPSSVTIRAGDSILINAISNNNQFEPIGTTDRGQITTNGGNVSLTASDFNLQIDQLTFATGFGPITTNITVGTFDVTTGSIEVEGNIFTNGGDFSAFTTIGYFDNNFISQDMDVGGGNVNIVTNGFGNGNIGVNLGRIFAGTLAVNTTGGNIEQSISNFRNLEIAADAIFDAGSNDINLQNTNNLVSGIVNIINANNTNFVNNAIMTNLGLTNVTGNLDVSARQSLSLTGNLFTGGNAVLNFAQDNASLRTFVVPAGININTLNLTVNDGAGANSFTIDNATFAATLNGNGGLDRLFATYLPGGPQNTWVVNGNNSGSLTDGANVNIIFNNIPVLSGGDGIDNFTVNAGASITNLSSLGNDDTFTINGATSAITMGDGNNNITINASGSAISINGSSAGSDTVIINGGSVGVIRLFDGDNSIAINGSNGIITSITTGSGNDDVAVNGAASSVNTIADDGGIFNTFNITNGASVNFISSFGGDNTVNITNGSIVVGTIRTEAGNDTINVTGAGNSVNAISAGAGINNIFVDSGSSVNSNINGGSGVDVINIDGSVGTTISTFDGDDVISLSGSVGGVIDTGSGGETLGDTIIIDATSDRIVQLSSIDLNNGEHYNVTNVETIDATASTATNNTLRGFTTGTNNVWTVSSANSGNVVNAGVTVDFDQFDSLEGNALVDDFTVSAAIRNISTGDGATNSVVLNSGAAVSGTITGGTGDETISINPGASVASISTGAGSDTFNVNTDNLTTTIDGGAGTDFLFASDSSNTNVWIIDGTNTLFNTGTTVSFSGIEDLTGGSGVDNFTITAGQTVGNINSGGDDDSLSINGTVASLDVGFGNNNVTLGAGGVITNGLTAAGGNDTINIAGSVAFISAGNGDNDITVSGSVTGAITGGSGVDTIDLSGSAASITTFANDDVVTVSGTVSGVIDTGTDISGDRVNITANGDQIIQISSVVIGNGENYNITGAERIDADGTTGNVIGNTLRGTNAGHAWQVNNANDGTVDGDDFRNFAHLEGGSGVDDFIVNAAITSISTGDGATNSVIVNTGGSLSGDIIGGAGDDAITIQNGGSARSISTAGGNDTITLYSPGVLTLAQPANAIDGGTGGIDTLVISRNDAGNDWAFQGDGTSGTVTNLLEGVPRNFVGIDGFIDGAGGGILNYSGLTNDITIDLNATSGFTAIVGNSGTGSSFNATLIGLNGVNSDWSIGQVDPGTGITDGYNDGTVFDGTTLLTFIDFNSIVGGDGNDTFTLASAAIPSRSILGPGAFNGNLNGGTAGTDILVGRNDLASTWVLNGSGNSTLNYTALVSALPTPIQTNFINVDDITAGNNDDNITVNAGVVLPDLDAGDGTNIIVVAGTILGDIIGGANDDTITLSGSAASINANGGNNNINITATASITGDITTGNGNDTIVLNANANSINAGNGTNNITLNGNLVADITGGTGADTIIVNGTTSAINAGDGSNDITLSISSQVFGDITGGTGDDVMNISGNANAINAGAGTNDITVAGTIATDINGGINNDRITITGSGNVNSINAGDGNNNITVDGNVLGSVNTASGNDNINVGGSIANDLISGSGDDTINLSGAVNGIIDAGFGTLDRVNISGTGDKTIQLGIISSGTEDYLITGAEIIDASGTILNLNGNTLLGLTNGAAAHNWVIDGEDTGTFDGAIRFIGFENIVAGGDVDNFVISNILTSTISGGDGNDNFTVTGNFIAVTLNGNNGDDTFNINGNVSNLTVNGDADSDTLGSLIPGFVFNLGPGLPSFSGVTTSSIEGVSAVNGTINAQDGVTTTWNITGIDSGTVSDPNNSNLAFSGFTTLNGGTGVDNFFVTATGNQTGTINSGGDNDFFDIAGNVTTINTGSGSDTIQIQNNLTSATISGGIGDDIFTVIGNVDGVTLNGDGGSDNFSIGTVTNLIVNGGTEVDFLGSSQDGFTLTLGNSVAINGVTAAEIEGVSAINGILNAQAGVITTWNINGVDSGTVTDPDNTNLAFTGFITLNGGTGVDNFNITANGAISGSINGGDGNDVLNLTLDNTRTLSALFANYNAGAGSDRIFIDGTANAYAETYQANVGGFDQFSFVDNGGITFTLNYAGVETVNNNLQSTLLTINSANAVNDIIQLGTNTFGSIFSSSAVTYQSGSKDNITVNSQGSSDIEIIGNINISGELRLTADQVNEIGPVTVAANRLIFDNVNTAGDVANRLNTAVNELQVDNHSGNLFVNDLGDLELAGISNTTGLIDIQTTSGSITSGINAPSILDSSGDLNLSANGAINIQGASHNLSGLLTLSAPSITLNNNTTTNLGAVNGQTINVNTTNGDIVIAAVVNSTNTGSIDMSVNQGAIRAIDSDPDVTVSLVADSITLFATDGIYATIPGGNPTDPADNTSLNVSTNRLHVTNTGMNNSEVILKSTQDVTIGALRNRGNISLFALGDINLDDTVDSNVNMAVIDANFGGSPSDASFVGDIVIEGDGATRIRTNGTDATIADFRAENLYVDEIKVFGENSNPIRLDVHQNAIINFSGGSADDFVVRFIDDRRPLNFVSNDAASLRIIFSYTGIFERRLIELETLSELDPAIFTGVKNYNQDNIAIMLPKDQLFSEDNENIETTKPVNEETDESTQQNKSNITPSPENELIIDMEKDLRS